MTGDKRRTEGRRKGERGTEGDICRTKKKLRGQRMDHYALLHQLLSPITTETAEGQ